MTDWTTLTPPDLATFEQLAERARLALPEPYQRAAKRVARRIEDFASDDMLDAFAAEDPHVRVLHLSRNFGHQPALQAGLAHAGGDGNRVAPGVGAREVGGVGAEEPPPLECDVLLGEEVEQPRPILSGLARLAEREAGRAISVILAQNENRVIGHEAHIGGGLAGVLATIAVEPRALGHFAEQVSAVLGGG